MNYQLDTLLPPQDRLLFCSLLGSSSSFSFCIGLLTETDQFFCGNGSTFCILVLVLLITFLMASSIINGDTTLFRDSDLFFCCSSWYILAGIFSAFKNWLLWDVEGSVGVLWNFDGTLSGEKGTKPVAAKPLLIFGKRELPYGLLDKYG